MIVVQITLTHNGLQVGLTRAVSALRPALNTAESKIENITNIGVNPGHDSHLEDIHHMTRKRKSYFVKALKDLTRNRNLGVNVAKNIFPQKLRQINKKKINKNVENAGDAKRQINIGETGKLPAMAWVN